MNEDSTKSNFDFIINQPGVETQKPKSSKIPLVIIGLLILLVLLIAVIVVYKVVKNVKPTISANQLAVTQVVEKYFYDASLAKDADAYNLLSPKAQARVSKQSFILFVGGVLYNRISFTSCKPTANPQIVNQTAKVSYVCPTKDNLYTMQFDLQLSNTTKGYLIDSYDMKATKK